MIDLVKVFFALIFTALLAWLTRFVYKTGKKDQAHDDMQQELDDIYKAKLARERLDSDPDYATKLHDRYTRK